MNADSARRVRVLILGGSGMLGHKLVQCLGPRFETFATFRTVPSGYAHLGILDESRALTHVSVQDFDSIVRAVNSVRPDVVVNCIGIVKQDVAAKDPLLSIGVNALFPHRLAQVCGAAGARLIQISTDCVFSGRKGNYVESDVSDAEDLYGRTKFLGEVNDDNCLTLRTSIIGRELQSSQGLIEWFLSQEGKSVRGFRRAIFSGFTTLALSEIIAHLIADFRGLSGVWHVAAEPITKFDLLSLVKQIYELNIEIEPDETFVCDRSLNGERFRQATRFIPPGWSEMIQEMYQDLTSYAELRRMYVNG